MGHERGAIVPKRSRRPRSRAAAGSSMQSCDRLPVTVVARAITVVRAGIAPGLVIGRQGWERAAAPLAIAQLPRRAPIGRVVVGVVAARLPRIGVGIRAQVRIIEMSVAGIIAVVPDNLHLAPAAVMTAVAGVGGGRD